MVDKITLPIPKELKRKLEDKIKETNFKSIQDYILYILEQMVGATISPNEEQIYTKEEEAAYHANPVYDEEEEAALKKKLAEMGYL